MLNIFFIPFIFILGTPLTPYNSEESKKKQVADMFNNVAGTYDFLNHFFFLVIDKLWRRKLVQLMGKASPKIILDLKSFKFIFKLS